MLNESLLDQHIKMLWETMASNSVGEAGNQKNKNKKLESNLESIFQTESISSLS